MNVEELLEVLRQTNRKKGSPVDDKTLEAILQIVMLNPLGENRGRSQEQIHYVLSRMKVELDENKTNQSL